MGAKDTFFHQRQTINIQGDLLDLSTPKVMGILNLTPDSFFDGGQHNSNKFALQQAENMLDQGADILDIGAQSTRPNASLLSVEEEWNRLKNILPEIRKAYPSTPISIDTFYAEIAQRAAAEGAHIINDVSGGTLDKNMLATVAKLQIPYILMHMRGTPATMQQHTSYKNVVAEVMRDLSIKITALRKLGLNDIIVDPGFGFAKTVAQNFEVLHQLADFKILGLPILAGLSRKSMITKTLNISGLEALNGTTALNAFALQNGANILRVHDVKAAKEVVTLHQIMTTS